MFLRLLRFYKSAFNKYTYEQKKVASQKMVYNFFYLYKISSVEEIIQIHYLTQTKGKFKKNLLTITVPFVHLNTNTPKFKIHKNRISDTNSPTDKKSTHY